MGCGASGTKAKDKQWTFTVVPHEDDASDCGSVGVEVCHEEHVQEAPRDIRDSYLLGEVLGSGAFGQVRSASLIEDPTSVMAVKVLEKDGSLSRHDLDLEVELLRQLDHDNIIRFFDFFEDRHFVYVVTEQCAGGEVFEKIVELRRFTENNAAIMGRQMLAAIEYIHKLQIVHRDVKAENFLLAEPTIQSKVKMIDFGMACRFQEGKFMSELCGSPHYVAPELIGQRYTELVDVWAFGVLMYLLMYGEYPYDAKEPKEIMIKVLTRKIRWQKRAVLSDVCLDLLFRLLQHDYRQRLTASEAARHAWFQQQEDDHCIPTENLRSAQRKVTSSRKTADPEVEELRNQKLQRLEEDWQKGLRNRCWSRPEVLRRENRLMTAPSTVKESNLDQKLSNRALRAHVVKAQDCVGSPEDQTDLRCPGGPDLVECDDDSVTVGRLPGPIKSSQSFPDSRDPPSARLPLSDVELE